MKPFPKRFFGLLMIYLCHFRWQIGCFLILMFLGIGFENLNIRFFSDIIGALKDNDFNSYDMAFRFVYLLIASSVGAIIFKNYAKYFFKAKFVIPCKILMEKELFSYLLGRRRNI